MQPDLLSGNQAANVLQHFHTHRPLVHCLTNDVVQTFTANTLLALRASPAMVPDEQEAAQFAALADALLINVGTLTTPRAAGMMAAIHAANNAGKPWALDPVAVGALQLRTTFAHQACELHPAAIRGNASEIMALAGTGRGGRGVDSLQPAEQAIDAAMRLARITGAVVAVTGEVDYVTDGERTLAVPGGDVLMTYVVGTGCALSAVVAASCALPGDRLVNVAGACRIMSCAGERAVAASHGPGSFVPAMLDALWNLSEEALA